jgi:hypothetical protein
MKSAKKQWRDFELLVTRIEAQAAPNRLQKNSFRLLTGNLTSRLEALHAIPDRRGYISLPPVSGSAGVRGSFSAAC